MKEEYCPNCGKAGAIIERTIYDEDLLEEISCPVCGYYDSKITSVYEVKVHKEPSSDFKF